MWIILSKRPLRPLEIKRNFCFLLHYLEEFELAAWLTIRVAIKKWLFLPTYMTGQTTNYWTCAVSAITLKPPGALLHPQLRISCGPQFPFLCLSLSCMQVLWLSHACGVPYTYICITPGYHLSLICLMSIWLLNQQKWLGVQRNIASSYIDLIPLTMKDYWVQFASGSVGEQTANPKDGKLKDKIFPNSWLLRNSFN